MVQPQDESSRTRTWDLYDLVVVGAGPSGLGFAFGAVVSAESANQSLNIAVLEARNRPGGWVHTRSEGPYLLETGPYGYLDKHPELGEIVSLLGLDGDVVNPEPSTARRRFVAARGRLRRIPTGPGSFIGSRILTLRGKLRLLKEPWSPPPPDLRDETVTEFATRHLGVEGAEALVVPMFLGIYAGDPDRASLKSSFPRMAELEEKWGSLFKALWALRKQVRKSKAGVGAPRGRQTSFKGGLGRLISALAGRLGGRLRFGTEVTSVTGFESGYELAVAGETPIRARQVVLALPARTAAPVLSRLDPDLAGILGRIPYTGVSVVHTAHRIAEGGAGERVWKRTTGTGFLIPRREHDRAMLGTVFVSSLFPGSCPPDQILLRSVLGGRLWPDAMDWPEERLLESVRDWHRKLLGLATEPVFVHVDRYPDALPQYDVGHGDLLDRIQKTLEKRPGLHLTGNAYRGIGLADCLALNFRSGRKMAEQMLRPGGQPSPDDPPGGLL